MAWVPNRKFLGFRRTYRWPQSCFGVERMGVSKLWRVAGMVGLGVVAGMAGCGDNGGVTPGQVGAGGPGGGGGAGATADAGPAVDPSVDGQLTINELMPDNVLTIRDDRGAA